MAVFFNNPAPLDSPAFVGVPTVPTAAVSNNTTQAASTAFVLAQIANDAPTKTGGGASGSWGISITGSSASTTGNAATATALSSARTFQLTGAVTGSVFSDLASGASITAAIGAGVIVNADVNASAAIAGTKISPDFGSQNVTTTGSSTAAQFVPTSSTVPTNGLYLPAANAVGIATGSSERFRVDPTGQVGIGATPGAGFSFVVGSQITGATAAQGITSQGTVQSGVTAAASYFRANISTAAASFTCTNVRGYYAFFSSLGASSVITNLYGFFADSGLTQGTNNFGYYSNISAAAGRWNFYANGTAENYFANNVKIGGTANRATTEGTAQLVIFNGTAPVGTLSNGGSFYASSGELLGMNASGTPSNLTAPFTSTVRGVVPASGGGTSNFLRADGTWAAPAGGGNVVGPGISTDNALVRFDGVTGTAIQDSGATLSDTGVLTLASGGGLVLPNGGATQAPLKIGVGGALLTTPEVGAFEADANCFYGCTDAGNRGVLPIVHILRQESTYTLSNVGTAQQLFNAATNGRLTLEVGVYEFEILVALTSMSATSGNATFSLAGTATLGSILWFGYGRDAAADATTGTLSGSYSVDTTLVAAPLITAATTTALFAKLEGTFEVTVAGTWQPNITLQTAAAAIVSAGSYAKVWRMGSTTLAAVGQWD